MKSKLLLGLTSVAGGLVAAAAKRLTRSRRPVLYVGGPVVTMNGSDSVVEALGIDRDRIVKIGKRDELERWAAEVNARVVDLRGRALLPGFIDGHGHFPGAGLFALQADLSSPPVGTVENIEELLARLQDKAKESPTDDWLVGLGYDDTLLRDKRHPDRTDLDSVCCDRPVLIWHVSFHIAVANSRALELAGVDEATPDPDGGRIQHDAETGAPNGVLEENAIELVRRIIPEFSLADGYAVAQEASRRYVSQGVTTAQNGFAEKNHMRSLNVMSRLGLLPLRLVMWPGQPVASAMTKGEFEFSPHDEKWVRPGAAKLLADGSIQGYTANLTLPYHVPPGDDPSFRGYPRIAREPLIAAVKKFHSDGWQIAVHGNGDATIDDILDAFEIAQKEHPRDDTRHVIVHAQTARDDQLDRMKALGVIPSFFVIHTYYWGDRHRDIFLGPERAARINPLASAIERGLHFTIHTDTPVVPMEPLRLVWSAVNRRTAGGNVLGESERIEPMRALRAVTIEAAYQHFEEDLKGSLEVGKLADLVILSESPLDNPEHIDEIRVTETIIGGQSVYRADSPLPQRSALT